MKSHYDSNKCFPIDLNGTLKKREKIKNDDISLTKGSREGHNSGRISLCHRDAAKSASDVLLFMVRCYENCAY